MEAVSELANEFIAELDESAASETVSLAYAETWFSNNIGRLNLLLDADFCIEEGLFVPELGNVEKTIYKTILLSIAYDKKIRNVASLGVGSGGVSTWTKIEEADTKITRGSPNETLKFLNGLRQESHAEISYLVKLYKNNLLDPKQVI